MVPFFIMSVKMQRRCCYLEIILLIWIVNQIVCQDNIDKWYSSVEANRYQFPKKTIKNYYAKYDNITFRKNLKKDMGFEDLRGEDPELAEHKCCKEVVKIGCSKCVHAGGLLYLCQFIDCDDKDATCTPGTWFNSENDKNCNECFCLDGTASFCYPYLCYGQKQKTHKLVRLHGVIKDKSIETCTPGHEFIQGVPSRCEGCKCKDNGRWACWHEYKSCSEIVPGLLSQAPNQCEVGKLWIEDDTCSVCYCLSTGQKMCGTGKNCTKSKLKQTPSCTNQKCSAQCYNEDKRTLGLCLEDDCVCTPAYIKK